MGAGLRLVQGAAIGEAEAVALSDACCCVCGREDCTVREAYEALSTWLDCLDREVIPMLDSSSEWFWKARQRRRELRRVLLRVHAHAE